MHGLRNSQHLPIYSLAFFSVAARVGFIMSTWVLLVSRFDIDPLIACITSAAIQGTIVVMAPLSRYAFGKMTLLKSQRIGIMLGCVLALGVLYVYQLWFFLCLVFVASISKVLVEGTFPRVTHAHIIEDGNFASRLVGVQQGAVLVVCAMIAPIALMGYSIIPMVLTAGLYFCALAVTVFAPECGQDSFEERITKNSPEETFHRRFSDMVINENIRIRQSRVHKYRRIPDALKMMDLFTNIICGGCAGLMPIVLRDVSKVSQGVDPLLCLVYGAIAAVTGVYLLPKLRQRWSSISRHEWSVVFIAFTLFLMTGIIYTTFFGVGVALAAAVVNGLTYGLLQSFIHHIGARHLTHDQYQQFGCQLMQRNAIARVFSPLVFGTIASITSLTFAMMCVIVLGCVFVAISLARVSLIVHGRKRDERILASITDPAHPARKLHTVRPSREGVLVTDFRASYGLVRGRRIRSGAEHSPHHIFGVRPFRGWLITPLPQKNSSVAPAGRSSRSG